MFAKVEKAKMDLDSLGESRWREERADGELLAVAEGEQ
jgi:hypothetical protein